MGDVQDVEMDCFLWGLRNGLVVKKESVGQVVSLGEYFMLIWGEVGYFDSG